MQAATICSPGYSLRCTLGAAGIVAATVLPWQLTGNLFWTTLAGCVALAAGAWAACATMTRLRNALATAGKRQADLQAALERAQRQAALGGLAAGIAHDLNNCLTVVSTNLELTTRALASGQHDPHRHIQAAMQGVSRAANLTNRVLGWSRAPASEEEAIDVNRLVGNLHDVLQRGLGERVMLDVRPAPNPWFVWADVNRMEAALVCLVAKAADGVRPGCRLLLSVGACPPAPADGPAADIVEIIAAPADDAAPRWAGVADLGGDLALAARFAQQAGGTLQQSGSAWRLRLPRFCPPSPIASGVTEFPRDRAAILVVEDDAIVREACAATLQALGYEVLEAPDAMEAFRLFTDRGGVDLLLIDIGLPNGVSGTMLAEAVRHAAPQTPILFISGYAEAAAHAAPLLRKPFEASHLADAVRAALPAQGAGEPPGIRAVAAPG